MPTSAPTRRRIATLLVLGLVFGFTMSTSALAQGFSPGRMKERLAAQTDETIEQLNLSEEQTPKVRTVLETANEKRMKLFMENPPQRGDQSAMAAFRAKIEELDTETTTALAEVLTEEQVDTYKKIQEDRAARRRSGPGGRRGM